MMGQFIRSEMVLGENSTQILRSKTVAIFGLGGVGSYLVESLARSGVGNFILVDCDSISLSNINRQLFATHSSIGLRKVDAARSRILDIYPEAHITTYDFMYSEETVSQIDISDCDFVADCIDTITSKLLLVQECKKLKIPLISSMGTGNKIDPFKFKIDDISKTSICPLARVIRKEVKRRRLGKLMVLYSIEEPVPVLCADDEQTGVLTKRTIPGSVSFIPSIAGLILSGYILKKLLDVNVVKKSLTFTRRA